MSAKIFHPLPVLSLLLLLSSSSAQDIGINYGLLGNNLPPPEKAVSLLRSRGVSRVRLFNPDAAVLGALPGSGIAVVLGTLNEDLPGLASDPAEAARWVLENVVPYKDSVAFWHIVAGNEVIPGQFAENVLPAMRNLDAALGSVGVSAGVTTAIATSALGVSFPPSQGKFSDTSSPIMAPILAFLSSKNTPLLVNVYPYFAYSGNPENVHLDYALFTATSGYVRDGSLTYTNMFDAILDAVYSAMESAGGPSVSVVVSETGWPSAGGGIGASVGNALLYMNNVVAHVSKSGSPKRPDAKVEVYLFALFNENQKPAGTEQNFGLYYPNMTEVYHIDLMTA